MSSLVFIAGKVTNKICCTEEGLCRFSVENEDGRFYIQTDQGEQVQNLLQADLVQIIGTLHSFVFPRCRCHHVYIEPIVIIRGLDEVGSSIC